MLCSSKNMVSAVGVNSNLNQNTLFKFDIPHLLML